MRLRLLYAAALAVLLPSLAWANLGPKAVIQETVDAVIDILKTRENPAALTSGDRHAISKAVEAAFDFREMARRSLGKGWRKISPAQRQEFTRVFRELIERSYGNRLAAFSGQTVEYGEVKKKKGRRVSVRTEIIDDKRHISVQYSLRESKHGWRVYNIIIEGVSLVSTYRTSFKSTMKKKGFDGLMQSMHNKLARLKEKDK